MTLSPYRTMIVLDCPDADALADFYARILGWEKDLTELANGWVTVTSPGGARAAFELACQEIPDYKAPTWPGGDVPQQLHLDFYVDSIDESETTVLAAGARRHEIQPSVNGSFVVYLDPVGHPFCLCQEM